MKTADAIEWAGSGVKLARRLGIKPQAIYQWGEDVPKLREYEIRELMEQEKRQKKARKK